MKLVTTAKLGRDVLPACKMVDDSYAGAGLPVAFAFLLRAPGGQVARLGAEVTRLVDYRHEKNWISRPADIRLAAREEAAHIYPSTLSSRVLYLGSMAYFGRAVMIWIVDADLSSDEYEYEQEPAPRCKLDEVALEWLKGAQI